MQNAATESGKDTQKSSNWGEGSTLSTANTVHISNQKKQGQSLLTAHNFMADLSESDDDEDSEVESFHLDQGELDDDFENPKFLLSGEGPDSPDLQSGVPETQARLEALLEAAGIGKLSTADGKHYADPEVLKKLTSSVNCALDEAAAALSRMRAESAGHLSQGEASLAEACSDGDAGAVKKMLEEGRSVNETTEEGDSLLSLACQAGYYELAQVLLAMRANVEDRGIKGDCTPLMEAASAGHVDIVKLLISHGADVNAQSSSGNTPLMYACAGGHAVVVSCLLQAGANVEDHNENGHTPLMESASAGHVGVAKILLEHGAGVNTHSNEFKESALTLACYKGHLEMVRFLLGAGADQEHKTDEMHTALMEASMDGHVEVARLLLDSGAQVNMPADSFESPLTLAACGGHVELAMLLLERGANIEEVNDEGYTPLMEAAREGHEEMVALLLSQGADINAQTEETQETALTLACCGGFLEVADFLIKAGADIELGASTPLMEAAQEGRLELVKYLLGASASVHACTQTGDTALTYACENGHTDVADLLLQAGADLEHESEGGRTPLMKAARAGHVCTVQFLISRGADINRQTTNNDHTPLSLACAGGHLVVVELLLAHSADPTHRLKDNSTMLIEASKGGHTAVVQLLLDYPHSMIPTSTPPEISQLSTPTFEGATEAHRVPPHGMPHPTPSETDQNPGMTHSYYYQSGIQAGIRAGINLVKPELKSLALRSTNSNVCQVETLTTAELQQVKNAPHLTQGFQPDFSYDFDGSHVGSVEGSEVSLELEKDVEPCERLEACINNMMKKAEQLHHNREEQILQKQQILEELQRVERELQEKAQAQILLSTQAQLRIEQRHHAGGQVLPQPCSHHGGTCASAQTFGSLLDLGREIAAQGDLGLEFGSPMTMPTSEPVLQCCSDDASSPMPPLERIQEKFKASKMILKKDCKGVGKQKDLKFQLQQHLELQQQQQQQQLQLIEEMERMNVKGLSLSPDLSAGDKQALLERLQVSCGDSLLDGVVSASQQVQSQDSAVVSVGMGVGSQLQLPVLESATVTVDNAAGFKTITQIKNHLNSAAVNTCSLLGNIPHAAPGCIPQLPVVSSQQHFVPTSTVATQYIDPSLPTSSSLTVPLPAPPIASPGTLQVPLQSFPLIDVNSQTDSNHDTALTLACAGGHEELVQLLLARGADIGMEFEHRDKKGFTPLILAATAGHAGVVDILLTNGADIEAQSERTKDTPLSLACSGGRYEVVEILLTRGANKEHRNVSDYTPLSLAASGGYVNIIKLLLSHGAEINSRTGSKLGISPLMLAAMNGHTAAVKLLLDMGSDINAQIETNRNTALTLACFQGRHEVVSLLVDRKANVEHRAKTGLTPLMEAASGGYVEVGRVLLDKGADVNAPPVPSSRDTALTIAADKGHYRFVELLLSRGAQVDVKNKKGNSPLWLAANGGHIDVVQLLVSAGGDIDSQDNRKVSCLMAAFRKGHVKVVKWMVKIVTQFPSDQEMTRYIATFSDNELLKKCHQCLETIRIAKERQAVEANKNASSLLLELDMEKNREENKKAAAARRRERKRKKKKEKQERKQLEEENKKNESKNTAQDIEKSIPVGPPVATLTTTVGSVFVAESKNSKLSTSLSSGITMDIPPELLVTTANCTTPSFANNNKNKIAKEQYEKLKSSREPSVSDVPTNDRECGGGQGTGKIAEIEKSRSEKERRKERRGESKAGPSRGAGGKDKGGELHGKTSREKAVGAISITALVTTASPTIAVSAACSRVSTTTLGSSSISSSSSSASTSSSSSSTVHPPNPSDRKRDPTASSLHHHYPNHHLFGSSINPPDDYSSTLTYVSNNRTNKGNKKGENNATLVSSSHRSPPGLQNNLKTPALGMSSPKRGSKREEGWKEVVRKLYVNSRSKKVLVPSSAISRVIGRGGCNINTIREVSGAVIEVEKQKGAGDRTIIIRGSAEATKQAHQLISMMVKDPEKDLSDLLPKSAASKSANTKLAGLVLAGNAGQSSAAAAAGGTQTRSSVMSSFLKSGNLPPSGVISNLAFPSSHPPFSGASTVRQPAAVRPGMTMTPAFPSQSSWLAFPGPSTLAAGGKKTANASMTFSMGTAQPEAANLSAAGPTGKSNAARQLFPTERGASQSATSTCTKTATYTSYTTAVMGSGKTGTTFASKITESRTSGEAAGAEPINHQQPPRNSKAANGNGVRQSQSGSGLVGHQSAPRSSSLPNGPVPGTAQPPSVFSAASSSQPGTPTLMANMGAMQPGRQASAPSPPSQNAPPSSNVAQEYSPFNNIFSKVAHQSVWGGKDKESNKGMNFASVAAGNVKTSSSQLCSSGSMGTPVDDGAAVPQADAAKAPGYRGNAHVSPGSSGGSISGDQISSNSSSRSCLPGSASSTPPIGPIAPPVGSSMRKSSPVDSVLSSSAPAGLNPAALTNAIGQRQSSHMQSMVSHNLQAPPGSRPSMELNANYPPPSQLSPSQGSLSGSYNATSYSSAPNSGNSNSTPSIQSNLNPNAPDFSSRSLSTPGNFHLSSQSHPQLAQLHLQRLASLQEGAYHQGVAQSSGPIPNFSGNNLTAIVSSAQSSAAAAISHNSVPHSSMAASQASNLKYAYQQQQQQSNNAFGSDFPRVNMAAGAEQLCMIGNLGHMNHQMPSMNAGTPVISMMPQFGQMMQGQRGTGNMSHSVSSASSKDDGSNISPSSSPHPSNPSSPMTLSGMSDHPSRSTIGDDRKLPRPIGTDRPHKKAQVFGNESSWRGSYGSSNDQIPNERLAPLSTNYMPHYVDSLGGIRENNHPLDTNFQHSLMQGPHPPRLNSSYPAFVNGLQQHVMMPQMYTAASNVGRDIWRDNTKMNVGAGAGGPSMNTGNQLPIGVNPGFFNPGLQQQSSESKPLWDTSNWTQGQM